MEIEIGRCYKCINPYTIVQFAGFRNRMLLNPSHEVKVGDKFVVLDIIDDGGSGKICKFIWNGRVGYDIVDGMHTNVELVC